MRMICVELGSRIEQALNYTTDHAYDMCREPHEINIEFVIMKADVINSRYRRTAGASCRETAR
jgi:hypothetical protein